MNKKETFGKVLWWSCRDGNGIICDHHGNEYYLDHSVVGPKLARKLTRGALVLFVSDRCDNILVAKSVSVPTTRAIAKYEERMKAEKNQLRLPIAG